MATGKNIPLKHSHTQLYLYQTFNPMKVQCAPHWLTFRRSFYNCLIGPRSGDFHPCMHCLYQTGETRARLVTGLNLTLQWRHNGWDCVSNRQPRDCLLNRLFRLRSKKTSKLRVTGLCAGNSPGPVNFPHNWPVTRKMFLFDDVIMSP